MPRPSRPNWSQAPIASGRCRAIPRSRRPTRTISSLGFVYLNSDFANAIGYSGKPIQLLVGIDPKGVLTGLKLVEHKEPIVLVGIPEERILEAVNKLIGTDMGRVASGAAPAPQVDIVSGATVTVLVIGDSIVRSATKLIRSGRLGAPGQRDRQRGAAGRRRRSIPARARFATGRASSATVRCAGLILTVADVNKAFEKSGNAGAAAHPEEGDPGRHLHRSLCCRCRGADHRPQPARR